MELDEGAKINVRVTVGVRRETTVRQPTVEDRQAQQREPGGEPVMFQTWRNLLFLHWEWDPAEIQARLPEGLYVDLHGNKAYVGLTPFFMNDIRASFLPKIPGASDFLEVNVRTYVHDRNGIPGVWFFSLDCNHTLAVWMAKIFYSLPYHAAEMTAREMTGLIQYECQRRGSKEKSQFHYRRENRAVTAQPGSLPFFLIERYLLFTVSPSTGRLGRARVHHAPWQLFHAHVGKQDDALLQLNGLNPRLRPADLAWFAEPVRVKIYAPEEIDPTPAN